MIKVYPNQQEEEFLNIAIQSFFEISNKISIEHHFNPEVKFSHLIRMMSIYTELLKYEPVKNYLEYVEKHRPPGEIIAYRYLEVIRHVLVHFSFYSKWNEVWFNKSLITWNTKHSKIDKFLSDYDNHESFKWRMWNSERGEMTYGYQLNFPKGYCAGDTIHLKNLIDEEKGIEFSVLMINRLIRSQLQS